MATSNGVGRPKGKLVNTLKAYKLSLRKGPRLEVHIYYNSHSDLVELRTLARVQASPNAGLKRPSWIETVCFDQNRLPGASGLRPTRSHAAVITSSWLRFSVTSSRRPLSPDLPDHRLRPRLYLDLLDPDDLRVAALDAVA